MKTGNFEPFLEQYRQDAFAAGMNGPIAKPIEIPKLMDTLAGILR